MDRSSPSDHAVGTSPERQLKLRLRAGESLPTTMGWLIDDGYLLLSGWSEEAESTTLGIWGPGSVVIPPLLGIEPLHLTSLSPVRVEEWLPSQQEQQRFLSEQMEQLASLLRFSRIRPAESRLFNLLLWMGERFGRVNSRGVSLSLVSMNLTHQQLAEIAGLTRVTVTKALTTFRREGRLIREADDELLRPHLAKQIPSMPSRTGSRRPSHGHR